MRMRILHTADWHLGKIVNEFSMLEDQAYFLDQLIQLLKDQEVDLLMMAGDLYDRSVPPKEAVNLFNRFLNRMQVEIGIPILIISGNHDSNERLEYGSQLLSKSGLYIEGTFKPKTRRERFGDIDIYMIPFADHVRVRHELKMEEEIKNLEQAVQEQVNRIVRDEDFDPSQKNILMMHGYVINQTKESIEESDSERPLSIGTTEYVDASLFDAFDYVALGHLHKAQKVSRPTIRYSGSPLKYSKSEANHNKKVYLIDTDQDMALTEVAVQPLRDLRVIKGEFNELIAGESQDYIYFELTDQTYVMEAMNKLRSRYPNAMGIDYINLKIKEKASQERTSSELRSLELDELFNEFYQDARDRQLDHPRQDIVHEITREVHKALKEDN